MPQPSNRSRKSQTEPLVMTDRERTIFAATEAVFGAGLVVAGMLVAGHASGLMEAIGLATLVLGAIAVMQAVLIGLGVVTIHARRDGDRR
jgi:hypothetical protein